MRSPFVARHRVGLASTLVVLAAVGALVTYALAVPGFKSRHADLDDGGVWVTRGGAFGDFGRINNPIKQLDGVVYPTFSAQRTSYNIDVLQDGSAVLARDKDASQAYALNPSGLAADNVSKVPVSGDDDLAMSGGTLALLDEAKGAIRAVTYDPATQLGDLGGLITGKPLATLGSGAALTVAVDGTIYAASASSGMLTTIRRTATGFQRSSTRSLGTSSGNLRITSVGDEPVVFDTQAAATSSQAILPGGDHVAIPDGASAAIQQAGPSADDVLVATSTSLLSIPLHGDAKVTTLVPGASGVPAAPVVRQQCAYAAWAGQTAGYASTCADSSVQRLGVAPGPLAFRANRHQVVLNDISTGQTWNLDSGHPQQIANWDQIKPPVQKPSKQTKNNSQNTSQTKALPPKARADELGARPGRTTALYVLDNDSDPAGETLAVDSVKATTARQQSWLSIAPDGQSVDINLPANLTTDTVFTYVVRAAKGGSAPAQVTVHARPFDTTNHAPTLRVGYTAPRISVPVGGTVTIPVLADWRDREDGDPVVLKNASTSGSAGGRVASTPDGDLIYTAPAQAGSHQLAYTVADTQGAIANARLKVNVQAPDAQPVAATARPDYARGRVGVPITVLPLANDLPGSDPLHPTASMKLAGKISSPAGTAKVTSNPTTGAVTVTSSRSGPLTLTYQVGYGGAPLASSTIRVDVDPASASKDPITAPDVAVLHGTESVTVDVLANDSDPAGNLLVVQSAVPTTTNQLRVAVIGGRYVRIAPSAAAIDGTQTVTYTVSDGVGRPVQGQISVTQLPAVSDDTPVTLDDYATVRGGQTVAIPVLDNDVSPSGGTLSLVRSVAGRPSGTFAVSPARAGSAYASGQVVRFVAPVVRAVTTAIVDYYAQNEAGTAQQVGHAIVTITPPPSAVNPNQPPVPASVEARAIAGQTVKIKIPTTGVDPDGDAVTVVGVGSATSLGRVLGFTASSLSYQAYPRVGNGGTDTFSYQVTDTQGASATGTIRVAVVAPGDPQPPVAVDDTVTASPGASVQVDALANDLVAPGDVVTVTPLVKTNPRLPAGVSLASPSGPIVVRAGANIEHPVTVNYQLDDGLHTSNRATITVRAQKGVNLPPLAYDQYAKPAARATSVSVDVLHGDYDPDSTAALRVVSPAGARNGVLTLAVTKEPRVVPYVIEDGDGAMASASVYVPAVGAGLPYATPKKTIQVPANGKVTVDIAGYVTDPAGKRLRTTTANTISASPSAGVTAAAGSDATHLVLTGARGYAGPGAVTFDVTDGATLTTPGAVTTTVTVPVQVGTPTPVLRCPSTGVDVVAGGPVISLPIATLCHVWTPNPADAASLRYHVTWRSHPATLGFGNQDSTRPTISAEGKTRAGSTGVLSVGVVGSKAAAATLSIGVLAAPKLTIAPITIEGVKAGAHRTVDLAGYVQSPLRDARVAVVGTPTASGEIKTMVSRPIGAAFTLSPASRGSGRVVVSFVVTDANNPARYVSSQLIMTVLGPPDAPTGLAAGRTVKNGEVDLTWAAPNNHGAPVTNYTVKYNGGARSCGAAPSCAVTGLVNGRAYTFTVIAINAVGPSLASSPATATPDRVPDAVRGLTGSNPQDGSLTLTWTPDHGTYSAVSHYTLSWTSSSGSGGQKDVSPGSAGRAVVTGLDNDSTYTFSIVSWNKQGHGPSASGTGLRESAGRPKTPAAPVADVQTDTASNNEVIVLSGYAVDPNGPAPTRYTVTRTSGASSRVVCADTTAATCTDTGVQLDGTSYTYAVKARNAATGPQFTSASSPGTTVEAAATPDPITGVNLQATGNNGEATLTFDAPASHGKSSTVTCTISGGGTCGNFSTTYPTGGQKNVSVKITGFSNGNSSTVTLQDCNGSSGGNHSGTSCDAAVQSNATISYGPIGNPSINVTSSGTRVSWSISVDPNGKPATVHVTSSHGYNQTFTTGTSSWGNNDSEDVGYSYTDTVHVDVSDSGRSTQSTQGAARSADPPPRMFEVTHGAQGSCSYGDSTCALVYVRIYNFPPGASASCFAQGTGGHKNWGPVTLTAGSDGTAGPINKDGGGKPLFDTSSGRFSNGQFAIGGDAGGLTCNNA